MAEIAVLKLLDIDGDLSTTDDQFPGEGWAFAIDTDGGISSASDVVTDVDGRAVFTVEIDGAEATLTVTEVAELGFDIVDAWCVVLDEQGEAVSDAFGLLDGQTLTFIVEPGATYGCVFYNSSGEVEEETGTPRVTLPPTDTATPPSSSAPQTDSWRILLVMAAALLASVLVLTPAPATARRR